MISTTVETSETYGDLIRRARWAERDPVSGRPLSQIQLAEQLGISDSLVSKWESNQTKPAPAMVALLAQKLPTLSVFTLLQKLGHDLGSLPLADGEREWLSIYRGLRGEPLLQRILLAETRGLARGLREMSEEGVL